jgi:hypothetical protein
MTLKRNMLRSLLALSALMVVGPAAAEAHTNSYACTVTGATGSLVPPIPSIVNDAQTGTGVQDEETGTYTFDGGGTCSKNDGAPYDVVIDSAGHYTNTVCGTGTATDDEESNTTVVGIPLGPVPPVPPEEEAEETVSALYHIVFEGGAGELTIDDARSDTHEDNPSPDEPGSGSGVIDIVPSPGQGNCVTAQPDGNVSEFTVSGAFTAEVRDRPTP